MAYFVNAVSGELVEVSDVEKTVYIVNFFDEFEDINEVAGTKPVFFEEGEEAALAKYLNIEVAQEVKSGKIAVIRTIEVLDQ